MTTALIFDGSDDYATLNHSEDFGDTGEYVIELSFNIDSDTVNDIHSILHGDDYFYYRQSNSRFYWAFSGSTAQLTGVAPIDVLGIDHIIELRQDAAGNKELYSSVFGSKSYTGIKNFSFDKLVRNNNWRLDSKLYYIKVYSDLAKTNLIRYWSPEDSDTGAGTPVLKETITGNDATGVNMPTDGSAWLSDGADKLSIVASSILSSELFGATSIEREKLLSLSSMPSSENAGEVKLVSNTLLSISSISSSGVFGALSVELQNKLKIISTASSSIIGRVKLSGEAAIEEVKVLMMKTPILNSILIKLSNK